MPLAFHTLHCFCMALLYGCAGRLTAKNGDFWPGQMGNQTRRMNHSAASPNARALIVNDRGVRRVVMYAIGAVAKVPTLSLLFRSRSARLWAAPKRTRRGGAGRGAAL